MKRRLALVLLLCLVVPFSFLLAFIIFGMQNKFMPEPKPTEPILTQPKEASPEVQEVLPQLKSEDFDSVAPTNSNTQTDVEYPLQYDPALYSDAELIAKAESLDFHTGGWPKGYDPFAMPDVCINSEDYIDIAKEYVKLYNEGKWGGNVRTKYRDLSITIPNGDLNINHISTGVRSNKRIFYDIVKELYDRGSWDGKPSKLGSHTIALNEEDRGYLLVDDYLSACYQRCFDLPTSFTYEDVTKTKYVSGEGIYVFYEDCTVTRYLRGKVEGVPAWVLNP